MHTETKTRDRSILKSVFALTFSRLIINITRRFPYPFINTIATQLGVPIDYVQNVVAVQAGIGVTSPLFGTLTERFGPKRVMLGSMLLMAGVSLLGVTAPHFGLFAFIFILYGVGKMIYDPAMQAYLGEKVPYIRRAQAIGITELSWAGSLFIAAPVAGFLLDTSGLQAIFALLAMSLVVATAVVAYVLPPDSSTNVKSKVRLVNPVTAWRIIHESPAAVGALAYSMLFVAANEIFFINYSQWMELSFELVVTTLGIVTVVIAVAEVVGEFGVIGLADRFGKRRMALIGVVMSGIGYLVLPLLSFSLPVTLVGLFIMFFFVEVAIVSSIPLFTELLPNARAVMMSGNVAAHSLGRMGGAWLGGQLYIWTGSFQFIGLLSMVFCLAAVFIMWRFIPEQTTATST